MPLRAIIADRLTLALLAAQHVDQWQAKDKTEYQRCDKRPTRTERDVAKEVKEIATVGKCG